jgi:glycerol uptake facilitator-like aquaporin
MPATVSRQLVAEALGTALLLATVIGSGVTGERLAGGNVALALLGNTLATGAILTVLIILFGPLSGAHFNPCVTLAAAICTTMKWRIAAGYIAMQIAGALVGVWLAHAMFDLPLLQMSTKIRAGFGQWLAEFVATFGLLLTIFGCTARAPAATPAAIGLYITAAYWFTA